MKKYSKFFQNTMMSVFQNFDLLQIVTSFLKLSEVAKFNGSNKSINSMLDYFMENVVHTRRIEQQYPHIYDPVAGRHHRNINYIPSVSSLYSWLSLKQIRSTHIELDNIESMINYALRFGSEFTSAFMSCKITNQIACEVAKRSPKLEFIYSDVDHTDDTFMSMVKSLPLLTKLEIQNCEYVSNAGLMCISTLKHLKSLRIQDTVSLKKETMNSIFSISTLTKLDIHEAEAADFSILLSNTNLKELDVSFVYDEATLDSIVEFVNNVNHEIKLQITMMGEFDGGEFFIEMLMRKIDVRVRDRQILITGTVRI